MKKHITIIAVCMLSIKSYAMEQTSNASVQKLEHLKNPEKKSIEITADKHANILIITTGIESDAKRKIKQLAMLSGIITRVLETSSTKEVTLSPSGNSIVFSNSWDNKKTIIIKRINEPRYETIECKGEIVGISVSQDEAYLAYISKKSNNHPTSKQNQITIIDLATDALQKRELLTLPTKEQPKIAFAKNKNQLILATHTAGKNNENDTIAIATITIQKNGYSIENNAKSLEIPPSELIILAPGGRFVAAKSKTPQMVGPICFELYNLIDLKKLAIIATHSALAPSKASFNNKGTLLLTLLKKNNLIGIHTIKKISKEPSAKKDN